MADAGEKRKLTDIQGASAKKHKKGAANQPKKPPTVIQEARCAFFSCFHKNLTDDEKLLPMKDMRV